MNSKLEGHNFTPNPDFASVGDIGKTQTSEPWLPFLLCLQSLASTECALQWLDMLCNVLTYVRTFCWRTVFPTSVTRCSIAPYWPRSIAWIAAVIACILYASFRVKWLIVHLVAWIHKVPIKCINRALPGSTWHSRLGYIKSVTILPSKIIVVVTPTIICKIIHKSCASNWVLSVTHNSFITWKRRVNVNLFLSVSSVCVLLYILCREQKLFQH